MILRGKDGMNKCLQEIIETDSLLDNIEERNSFDFLKFKRVYPGFPTVKGENLTDLICTENFL